MTMAYLLLTATRVQSSLDSSGKYASSIESLWWVFFWISTVVYILVIAAMLMAILRRRRTAGEIADETRAKRAVTVASGATIAILFGLLIASIWTGRGIAEVPKNTPIIVLTGKQWWWQIEYDDVDKSKRFTTANEMYVPVGQPVLVRLRSSDVIHSFWIPNLQGKRDLLPGREGGIVIEADHPGVYRGQCAEFCGLQHAKMSFWVNAVHPDEYARWLEAQRQSSKIPSTDEQRKGQEVFTSSGCPLCHTVSGTDASGKTGPDLTHFASRRSIAAGTLPNRRGFLAGWISDPQHIKPGSYMPPMPVQAGEMEPLLAYMESLR
jgi:cytochrome c oxidase subunit II